MNTESIKLLMLLLGIGASIVALVFVFFVPNAEKVNALTGIQFVIVRWFHSLCWVLIAINFFLRAFGGESTAGIANLFAAAGGITYLIFLINFVQSMGK